MGCPSWTKGALLKVNDFVLLSGLMLFTIYSTRQRPHADLSHFLVLARAAAECGNRTVRRCKSIASHRLRCSTGQWRLVPGRVPIREALCVWVGWGGLDALEADGAEDEIVVDTDALSARFSVARDTMIAAGECLCSLRRETRELDVEDGIGRT